MTADVGGSNRYRTRLWNVELAGFVARQVVVDLIAATSTHTRLTVQAALDEGCYSTGVKISDKQLAELPVQP